MKNILAYSTKISREGTSAMQYDAFLFMTKANITPMITKYWQNYIL